jgi:hypothetical protein
MHKSPLPYPVVVLRAGMLHYIYKFYVATPLYRGLTSCQQRPSTLSNSNFTGAFKNKNQVASIHVEQNKIQIAHDSCSQILT